ncbi:unnamed protein product [Rodentolepis nana]|uniref:Uncharacterized protein n=1 Tax=Rodentolepis nana TaxID=102285 RepID=A0A0R3TI44_RODNA|nr:unnamed protein product [Rodentolepis nana]
MKLTQNFGTGGGPETPEAEEPSGRGDDGEEGEEDEEEDEEEEEEEEQQQQQNPEQHREGPMKNNEEGGDKTTSFCDFAEMKS